MRRLFVLALALVGCALSACNGNACNGNASPVISLRNPFQIDREPATVAGERARIRYAPVMEVPAWQAIQAPNACGPAFTPGGGGSGVPESVPAVRR